jgi:hypothetical protein
MCLLSVWHDFYLVQGLIRSEKRSEKLLYLSCVNNKSGSYERQDCFPYDPICVQPLKRQNNLLAGLFCSNQLSLLINSPVPCKPKP